MFNNLPYSRRESNQYLKNQKSIYISSNQLKESNQDPKRKLDRGMLVPFKSATETNHYFLKHEMGIEVISIQLKMTKWKERGSARQFQSHS